MVLGPQSAWAGTIEGRVTLPAERPGPVVNRRYDIMTKAGVDSANPPRAVVYLEGNFPPVATPPTATIEQKELRFVPSLLAVQVGTRVLFPNADPNHHNIFSLSPPARFDLGRYGASEKPVPSHVFDKPGLVRVRCDIHEHMRALILVLATPHFVITDAEGRYRLGNLPDGNYTLKVWMDSSTVLERPVRLEAGSALRVDFP